MNGLVIMRVSIGWLLVALVGCSTTNVVPGVIPSLNCHVPDKMLSPCSEPRPIKLGITFGEMINISSRDRDALRECEREKKELIEAVAACNSNIDGYNTEIRDLNARNAKP